MAATNELTPGDLTKPRITASRGLCFAKCDNAHSVPALT